MRRIFYGIILLLMLCVPLERLDVAKLLPIEAVALYINDGQIVLETDTQDVGKGTGVEEALQNLKDVTPAVVYLDTAEFLLVSEKAMSGVNELSQFIKPSVKVCVCDAAGRVKEAIEYLNVHGNLPVFRDWMTKK